MRTTAQLRIVAAAALLTMSACGSGSGSENDADTTSSTTDTSTSTTLVASAETDAAALSVTDLGGDWREYPEAPKSESGGGDDDGCAGSAAQEAFEAATAETDGKLLQRGDLDRYVQTVTYGFDSADDAMAFARSRVTDRWIECVRASTEAGLPEEPAQTVKTYGVMQEPDGEFIGQYSLEFDEEIDGKQQFAGAYAAHTIWQKGAIVIDVFFQSITREGDAEGLEDAVNGEIDTGIAKVLERVDA